MERAHEADDDSEVAERGSEVLTPRSDLAAIRLGMMARASGYCRSVLLEWIPIKC